jgi:hypothetical protein
MTVTEKECECLDECICENDNQESEQDIIYESVYFKYCFDGCESIDEILCRLDALKQEFEEYKKEGHKLTQSVDNGYCFIDKIADYE